jgi:hypothetical protein
MSFEPQNALESSLMKAAGDPAHRPQFYRDLLESQIYLIQPIPADSESDPDRVRVSQGESIQIGLMERTAGSTSPSSPRSRGCRRCFRSPPATSP